LGPRTNERWEKEGGEKRRGGGGEVGRMGERYVVKILVGIPEGKWPLGRHRSKWEYIIKMDFQEVECGRGMD
jgi:hypothetical protein